MSHRQAREWKPLDGYALSHCSVCKGSFVRRNSEGLAIIFCHLDHAQIPDGLTMCENYDPDPKKTARAKNSAPQNV